MHLRGLFVSGRELHARLKCRHCIAVYRGRRTAVLHHQFNIYNNRMLIQLLAINAAAWTAPALQRPPTTAAALARARQPQAGLALDTVSLSLNPMSLTVLAFTVAWGSAPFIGANEGLRKLDAIQGGPKMRRMDKNERPRVRGKKLSAEAQDLSRTFQRQYDAKDLELLWAALVQCYASESRALAAVRVNPQMLNPSYR